MKVISRLLMFTLVLSVFAGCKKEDENLPLKDVAGTYEGTITATIVGVGTGDGIPNVPITITYKSGDKISLSIPGAMFDLPDITAECTVTSTKDSYSIEGEVTIEAAIQGMEGLIPLTVTVKDSEIDKSGKAVINMEASIAQSENVIMTIKFEGQKK